eukprot:3047438-Pyramimonas_sp.AAC.1
MGTILNERPRRTMAGTFAHQPAPTHDSGTARVADRCGRGDSSGDAGSFSLSLSFRHRACTIDIQECSSVP